MSIVAISQLANENGLIIIVDVADTFGASTTVYPRNEADVAELGGSSSTPSKRAHLARGKL